MLILKKVIILLIEIKYYICLLKLLNIRILETQIIIIFAICIQNIKCLSSQIFYWKNSNFSYSKINEKLFTKKKKNFFFIIC